MPPYIKKRRSVAKSITFRILVILSDLAVIYFFTHRTDVAIGLTIATNLFSTTLYFIHERVWSRIAWGRSDMPDEKLRNSL